ncbi:amino acid synthesis family protein|uniref:Amino acid synthesis n=1 Tax=Dendrosporobacter quercicolus TaxID=146817 RepID=A0A1G9QIC7_9FIRM|nr:amino acid synthesis family protein [Dendrosporobacter quercicolus]NSL48256.1 amino acid synthesis family protein [Dendrosporobacter quercicolus DSM 1736]SDM10798.1 Amino acid synthesis [Dendrosporobacter quercicolus]
MSWEICKVVTVVEEVYRDGQKAVEHRYKKCAALAVIKNPFAGRYVEDLSQLTAAGEYLGGILTQQAVAAMDVAQDQVESYGKGAIIGSAGELEHGAAILHPKLGKPMRDAVGGGKAIIPSAKKIGVPGTTLDVPLHYKDAAFVRTHYDAMEVRLPDAPKADEIVVAIVLTSGGRPHPRIGGLQKDEITGQDGLR